MAVALGAGLYIFSSDGFPERFDPHLIRLAAAESDASQDGPGDVGDGGSMDTSEKGSRDDLFKRQIGLKDGTARSFVLWGDSHADAFYTAVNEAAIEAGRAGVHATLTGCAPPLGVNSLRSREKNRCRGFNDAVLNAILEEDSLQTVILAARWALPAEGVRYKNESKKKIFITDDLSPEASLGENKAVFVRGLERTLKALRSAGRRVVIVGPVPEPGFNVPRALAMQQRTDTRRDIAPRFDEFLERQGFVLRTLEDLANKYDAMLIFPHEVLCDRSTCSVERDGYPMYSDEHHLSRRAAMGIHQIFKPVFN